MIKTIELRKFIYSLLKSAHSRVYFQHAPDTASTPYLVYDLPDSSDDGSTEIFFLDIDGWDVPADGSSTALETMMGAVDAALHRKTMIVSGQISATFYRESRLAIPDDDPRVLRRRYTYQIRTHEGS